MPQLRGRDHGMGTILHSEPEDATPMSPVPVDTTMPENSQMDLFQRTILLLETMNSFKMTHEC